MSFLLSVRLAAALAGPGQDGVIELKDAWASPAAAGGDVAVYLTIANVGAVPFAVLEATTTVAEKVEAVGLGARGAEGERMESAFAVMPKRVLVMDPKGAHLVLRNVRQAVRVGEHLKVVLRCVSGLRLTVDVVVRPRPAPPAGVPA